MESMRPAAANTALNGTPGSGTWRYAAGLVTGAG